MEEIDKESSISKKIENPIIADLHIHSRFSRACSSRITIPELVRWAKVKGLGLLGTGDFTHPEWLKEIKENLRDNGKGIYYYEDFPFILSGEISLMYTDRKGRRIHLVLLVPNLETADKINSYLDTKGRRDYDGRPIFKIPGDEFVRELKKISEEIEVIPAHIWTPWFGIFGSNSGFDSLKECFKDELANIHAIETGMSSDPPMNWRIKDLERISIVSFSDSHSFWPWRLGRESTVFRLSKGEELSYEQIIKQIRENSFIGTIETDPGYGIYHYDGHRNCGFSCSPEETKKLKGICPKCKNLLTLGVDYRVGELASSDANNCCKKIYYKLLPLHEIISLGLGVGMNSKSVWKIYNGLIENFGNEFNILLKVSKSELAKVLKNELLVDLIMQNREGKIKVKPGYDGVYGQALLSEKQSKLF